MGWFDAAFFDATGVTLVGWSLDPDSARAVTVHAYVDGGFAGSFRASVGRPDVAAVLGVGANHGFNARFQLGAGNHSVCLFAINAGSAPHTPLGCMAGAVTDPGPVGNLDAVVFDETTAAVIGWALDHDTPGQQLVHVYVDGSYAGTALADVARPDVASVLGVGPNHGFNIRVPVGAGSHSICAYALSGAVAPHTFLGCRTG